jgi:hypothetical protein
LKRAIFIWFLCVLSLFGATLKDARVDFVNGGVELTLHLDSAFNGKISETREDSQIVLTINDLQTSTPYIFTPKQGALVSTARISPRDRQTIVRIAPRTRVGADARVIGDGKTLLIRLTRDSNTTSLDEPIVGVQLTQSYMIAGIFLAGLLLLWIMARLVRGGGSGSWLLRGKNSDIISVVWQKPIDAKNRFILARFRDKEFLLLVGQSNLLLDSSGAATPEIDEDAFEALLRANSVKLSDYLKENDEKKRS